MSNIIEVENFDVSQAESYNIRELVATIIVSEDNFDTLTYNKLLDGNILKLKESDNYIILKLTQITNASQIQITNEIPAMWDKNKTPGKVNVKEGMRIEGIIERCIITEDKEEIVKEII